MKYKSLRTFMKKKNLSRPYTYANKSLVIDGLCFHELYKRSGCSFVLGGEYDRFASYLKYHLNTYIKSNIKCYVIFNGAANRDISTRKEIHQKIIDRVDAIRLDRDNEYCEPVFVSNVYREIFDELGIKCYVCLYDNQETLFSLAYKLKCPILSNNIEYALYGVSVIPFKSVSYNKETNSVTCSIYYGSICRRWNSFSDDVMSLVLTIADEDSCFYHELLRVFQCREVNFIPTVLYWIRRQSKEGIIKFLKSRLQEREMRIFLETFTKRKSLFRPSLSSSAEMALLSCSKSLKNNREWFEYNVGIGNITKHFINLKINGIFSGSWLVYDKNRDDAILPVLDIAFYVQCLLRNSSEVEIEFIGRKKGVSDVSVFKKTIDLQSSDATKRRDLTDFKYFMEKQLPGFHLAALEAVSEDSWMLLISMLYYSRKVDKLFIKEAYCIILSYVLLGPISEKVGLIKKSNFCVTHGVVGEASVNDIEIPKTEKANVNLSLEQCMQAACNVVDLFYQPEGATATFDRDTLHTFAEFQHCLQFMNDLNNVCGKQIKCTVYHKTINCTFIYNLFLKLKENDSPEGYIEKLLDCSEVFKYFRNIMNTYLNCLSLIGKDRKSEAIPSS